MLSLSVLFCRKGTKPYLLDGKVEFVKGCLLVHALPVVALVEISIADGDAVVESAEDTDDDSRVVIASTEDSNDCEDVSEDAELEIGDTVR